MARLSWTVRYWEQVNGALLDMTGFHTRRNEFEPEWDNAAEYAMAELEFREDDTEVGPGSGVGLHCLGAGGASTAEGGRGQLQARLRRWVLWLGTTMAILEFREDDPRVGRHPWVYGCTHGDGVTPGALAIVACRLLV